nr:microtubule cross-linking factor 1-like [Aegilops tauschii subsp. strangulata]
MISRGDAFDASPAGAAAGSAAAPLSAVGAHVLVSQPAKPSGLVLQKRPREYAGVDQPTSAAKKKKEVRASSETQLPAVAVPPPARKGSNGSRASAAGSSSRDLEARPQEKVISTARPAPEAPAPRSPAEITKAQEPPNLSTADLKALEPTPPLPIVPLGRGPPASPDALEDALSALTQLRVNLQSADRRLASGRLELAVAASEEGKQAADLATVAREDASKDTEAAKERCRVAQAELETLRNERATKVRQHEVREEKLKAREDAVTGRDTELEQSSRAQAAERNRLEKLKKEVEREKALLEAKANTLAIDRAAFDSLEERSRKVLRELYGRGLKKPLVTAEEGRAELLPQLAEGLEGVANKAGSMVEGEARALSSSAMMRIFSHLHLRDPSADLGALLEPVDEGRCAAAAEVMKDLVEALLKKFLAIDPAPPADGVADPTATADGTGDGDATDGLALLVGGGCAQG